MFGWQKPCYLIQDGYAASFAELMDGTEWERYGRANGNAKCRDCMVHCGYEATAVHQTFNSLRGLAAAARVLLFGGLSEAALPGDAAAAREPPAPQGVLVELEMPG